MTGRGDRLFSLNPLLQIREHNLPLQDITSHLQVTVPAFLGQEQPVPCHRVQKLILDGLDQIQLRSHRILFPSMIEVYHAPVTIETAEVQLFNDSTMVVTLKPPQNSTVQSVELRQCIVWPLHQWKEVSEYHHCQCVCGMNLMFGTERR